MRRPRLTDWVFLALAMMIGVAAAFVALRPTPGPGHSAHRPVVTADLVPAAHSDGLSEAESGYRFERVTTPAVRGPAVPVAFRILGPDGKPVTRFLDNQTKQMHFFAVRDDMNVFQHVHPTLDGETWRTALALTDGGAYRMFAEFVPLDTKDPRHPVVLGVPFTVPGDTTFVPVPAPAGETVTATGYRVARVEGTDRVPLMRAQVLRFAVRDPGGALVTAVDPHLGANGHLTGFHTMLLSATHLHPVQPLGARLVNGELAFHSMFSERGEYRLFLEFSHGGRVHTAAITVAVG
ncbi:hypothetical protein [Amycolatopsis regifaucium]|uniref:Heavy metal-binding domain-containing protein n=1 Tax=Amycolatopsis regifaucium TaxID=546365 RepID=A0A154M3Z5_9PSEU|nr:hypothetical protein [Amycolatopsis regifaucium]KZB79160.1 hypothetical protein AVL48_16255 [Amycolatopsis regifaucium]OKA07343.1 hypothetical protein ATP06_0215935 [Amycolatopsis regifaucium]SFH13826.1 hypothetical protein SAMN04489731_102625 [Amycolatopsis regifaucium]